jgi:phage tail-like protein
VILPAPPEPNGKQPLPYTFSQFLPALYQSPDGEFLRRFLGGLEYLWTPMEGFLEDVSALYDTRQAPVEILPWLASWVGLVLDANWPENKRRLLVRKAVHLYQWRGTRKGIEEFLEVYTGIRPQISEPFQGSVIGPETVIGADAVIGDVPEHCFVVTVFVSEGEEINERAIRAILDAEKPAHTAYDLRIERRRIAYAAIPAGQKG